LKPIGKSKPDWQIICEIAQKMGAKGFDFSGSVSKLWMKWLHSPQAMEALALRD